MANKKAGHIPAKSKERRTTNPAYAKGAYEAYVLWTSLPDVVKTLPPAKLSELGFDMNEGSLFARVVQFRFKKDFAAEFKLNRATMYEWEKKKDFWTAVSAMSLENNVLRFEKSVDFHFTQKAIKEADAPRIKLWKQLFKGWQEKAEVEHVGEVKFTFVRKKS